MKFERIKNSGIIKGYVNLLSIKEENRNRECQIRSGKDFSILKTFSLGERKFAYRYFEQRVILTDLKQYHIEIEIDKSSIDEESGDSFNASQDIDFSLRYYPASKEYVSRYLNEEKKKFTRDPEKELKFYKSLIIEVKMNGKTNSSIKVLDAKSGSEIWEKEYAWEIVRCEQYDNLLILDYHTYDNLRADKGHEEEVDWSNPDKYTIAVNCVSGEEVWKHPFEYSKIDKTFGVALSGGREISEVDLKSGKIVLRTTPNPSFQLGYFPHFVDDGGVYYTINTGSFGKMNKKSGEIEWEFDLLDEKGVKRELSEWLVLGNGKLLLQALPNHPNGDLMCIFDPEENIDLSKVKNSERLT